MGTALKLGEESFQARPRPLWIVTFIRTAPGSALPLNVYANFYRYVLPHDPGKSKSLLSWEDAMAANTPRKPFWAATMVPMALSSSTVCSAGGQIETFDHRSASQRNTSNPRDVDTGIDNASHNRSANDAARREHSGVRLFRNVNHPRSTYISATVFP